MNQSRDGQPMAQVAEATSVCSFWEGTGSTVADKEGKGAEGRAEDQEGESDQSGTKGRYGAEFVAHLPQKLPPTEKSMQYVLLKLVMSSYPLQCPSFL